MLDKIQAAKIPSEAELKDALVRPPEEPVAEKEIIYGQPASPLQIWDVIQAVWQDKKFITPNHPDYEKMLKRTGIKGKLIGVKLSEIRLRANFNNLADPGTPGALPKGVKIRQAFRPDGTYEQMVKVGASATRENPICDRVEYNSLLTSLGANPYGIKGSKKLRDAIAAADPLRATVATVSCRLAMLLGRGRSLLKLEAEFKDTEGWAGFIARDNKIELEEIGGAGDLEERTAVMMDLHESLTKTFGLVHETRPSSSIAFDHVRREAATRPYLKDQFENLPYDRLFKQPEHIVANALGRNTDNLKKIIALQAYCR